MLCSSAYLLYSISVCCVATAAWQQHKHKTFLSCFVLIFFHCFYTASYYHSTILTSHYLPTHLTTCLKRTPCGDDHACTLVSHTFCTPFTFTFFLEKSFKAKGMHTHCLLLPLPGSDLFLGHSHYLLKPSEAETAGRRRSWGGRLLRFC